MAGDWIKFEHTTPDKPEVVQMASTLHLDQDAVIGKLLRVWIWADQNSISGIASGVTEAFIDRLTCKRGFAAAMRDAGWLINADGGIEFTNFSRNNGATAKARAMDNRKKASQRERAKVPANAPLSVPLDGGQSTGQTPGPEKRREEKRREDIIHTEGESVKKAAVAAPTLSDADFLASLSQNSAYEGIDVAREHSKCLVWCIAHRKQPTQRRFINWLNRCDRPMAGATIEKSLFAKRFDGEV